MVQSRHYFGRFARLLHSFRLNYQVYLDRLRVELFEVEQGLRRVCHQFQHWDTRGQDGLLLKHEGHLRENDVNLAQNLDDFRSAQLCTAHDGEIDVGKWSHQVCLEAPVRNQLKLELREVIFNYEVDSLDDVPDGLLLLLSDIRH